MITIRLEKGRISNFISFLLLVIGVVISPNGLIAEIVPAMVEVGPWILAVGMFGFAGGVTNWLAVKMLFDRVPLLYGSGVIPNRFREIRTTIKDLIMEHFFDEEYLRRFFAEQSGIFETGPNLSAQFAEFAESDEARAAIDREIDKLKEGPFGMMIRMAGNDILRSMIIQFISGLLIEIGPRLQQKVAAGIDVGALRTKVDLLLQTKLEELTPETVKAMMEEVIREHLGWLIVWGNVFGGAIGLLSRAIPLTAGVSGIP